MAVLWNDYAGHFAAGLGITLYLTAASFVLAMVLGTVVATFRISPIAPLRAVGRAQTAGDGELARNPRARSAVLRIAEKPGAEVAP